MNEMIKKWGRERFYISCNYSCTISFLLNILLAKLKNLYSVCLNLESVCCNKNVKVKKMVVFVETLDYYITILIILVTFSAVL